MIICLIFMYLHIYLFICLLILWSTLVLKRFENWSWKVKAALRKVKLEPDMFCNMNPRSTNYLKTKLCNIRDYRILAGHVISRILLRNPILYGRITNLLVPFTVKSHLLSHIKVNNRSSGFYIYIMLFLSHVIPRQ